MTDVGTAPFEPWPESVEVHLEWGPTGARLAGDRGDVVVIVDVLSFSTSVALAVARGATVLSYSPSEIEAMGGRDAAARSLCAEIVAKDRTATAARFSLSPASLGEIAPGDRVVFTSLNGAVCTSAAANAPRVLVGALTNRAAIASAVDDLLRRGVAERCTIVPAGERWTSVADELDSLRPAVEDLLGAGAIVDALAGLRRSPEAGTAAAAFAVWCDDIGTAVRSGVSGRELIARGFPDDVELALGIDTVDAAPCWDTAAPLREFRNATRSSG
jgi:2-phosphosulfolactate phosphatase